MAKREYSDNQTLRRALEANGQRYTEQRAAVFKFLSNVESHPTADEVFLHVRGNLPGISLATVYKSLETLVGCGLAMKLSHSDGCARYDGRTDPHHHLRCLACGCVTDIPGSLAPEAVAGLKQELHSFHVVGYTLELTGFCSSCAPGQVVGTA